MAEEAQRARRFAARALATSQRLEDEAGESLTTTYGSFTGAIDHIRALEDQVAWLKTEVGEGVNAFNDLNKRARDKLNDVNARLMTISEACSFRSFREVTDRFADDMIASMEVEVLNF